MAKFSVLNILVFLLLMNASWTDELLLPEAFNLLEINGEKPKTTFFSSRRKCKLIQGENQIVVQYVDYYDVGFDDHEKVKSEPIKLVFNHEGGDLVTNFVRPESLKAAREYAKNPKLGLVQKSSDKPVVMEKKTTRYSPKKLADKPLEPREISVSKDKKTTALDESSLPLENLRYWWKAASYEERQTFMREILK